MARILFLAVVWLSWFALTASSLQSGPVLAFFNYSGTQATVRCEDHADHRMEAGETFSVALTRSNQPCVVTLPDGEHASATVDKVLPSSPNSGHSVSVDINDTFLFFSLDDTPHHQYVNFLDGQDEQIKMEKSADLLLWSMENASDE